MFFHYLSHLSNTLKLKQLLVRPLVTFKTGKQADTFIEWCRERDNEKKCHQKEKGREKVRRGRGQESEQSKREWKDAAGATGIGMKWKGREHRLRRKREVDSSLRALYRVIWFLLEAQGTWIKQKRSIKDCKQRNPLQIIKGINSGFTLLLFAKTICLAPSWHWWLD